MTDCALGFGDFFSLLTHSHFEVLAFFSSSNTESQFCIEFNFFFCLFVFFSFGKDNFEDK